MFLISISSRHEMATFCHIPFLKKNIYRQLWWTKLIGMGWTKEYWWHTHQVMFDQKSGEHVRWSVQNFSCFAKVCGILKGKRKERKKKIWDMCMNETSSLFISRKLVLISISGAGLISAFIWGRGRMLSNFINGLCVTKLLVHSLTVNKS